MVAEGNETQSKQKAQHTKKEIKALEDFLRLWFGMTPTEVSSVWREYGPAKIARMQQEVYMYEEDMQHKAQTQEAVIINERKQHSTIEEKRSEEIAATQPGATIKAHTQPEEELTTKKQQQKSEATTKKP